MSLANKRWFRTMLAIILTLIIIFLLDKVSFIFTPLLVLLKTIFLPFVIAGILFYLCRPLVNFLEKKKVPKGIAIIMAYVSIVLVVFGMYKMIGPVVNDQLDRFVKNIPEMSEAVQEGIEYVQENRKDMPEFVKTSIENIGTTVEDNLTNWSKSFLSFITGLFNTIFYLVLVPFILFYMLKDSNRFVPFIERFFPQNKRKDVNDVFGAMDKTISSYIQGQVFVSVCVGTLLYIGYLIIGLEYPLVLALFGLFTNVIPFLGPFLAVIPALLVAIFQDPIMVVYVGIIMLVAQQIEGNIISPQVMGKTLKIHPLTIIVLILFAGNLVGFVGIIFVIPVYAVSKTVITHLYKLIFIK
ncbi:AI-2E family transporter [Bacillus sp. 2205SS5-2]|uniref:AI-2E family transporter n=1 Tax=Bacillus sp. 2205SS5-2 TaxID=3109031 RepID=UPI003004F32E